MKQLLQPNSNIALNKPYELTQNNVSIYTIDCPSLHGLSSLTFNRQSIFFSYFYTRNGASVEALASSSIYLLFDSICKANRTDHALLDARKVRETNVQSASLSGFTIYLCVSVSENKFRVSQTLFPVPHFGIQRQFPRVGVGTQCWGSAAAGRAFE